MGGSGGSSGQVDYPDYMKTWHGEWLAQLDALLDGAIISNPHASHTAYDPGDDLTTIYNAICTFDTIVDALSHESNWESAFTTAQEKVATVYGTAPTAVVPSIGGAEWETELEADVTAFSAVQGDALSADVLPKFRAGMQDLNAVHTSSFTIGEAILTGMAARDTAKYQGDLRTKAFLQKYELLTRNTMQNNKNDIEVFAAKAKIASTFIVSGIDRMLTSQLAAVEYHKAIAGLMLEYGKVKIQACDSYNKTTLEQHIDDAEWELTLFQHAGNLLGSISGTAVSAKQKKSSPLMGLMSGAAGGAMMGSSFGPWGTIIGAVVGGLGGLLM